MLFEKAQDVFPMKVTPDWGKGLWALGGHRVGQLGNRDEPPSGLVCDTNHRQWGVCVPALKLHWGWKGPQRKGQGQNRVREILLLGIAGRLAET